MARILVADDSADMRRLYADVLRRDDHDMADAEDGAIAFGRLMAEPFDLVILDVMMPQLDGLSLCRMIRDIPSLSALPVIVVSGASTEVAALAVGADAFLGKPFRPSRLLQIIATLTANGRPRPVEPALPPTLPPPPAPGPRRLRFAADERRAGEKRATVGPGRSFQRPSELSPHQPTSDGE